MHTRNVVSSGKIATWFLMPKLRKNSTSVGASTQTPLEELTAPPRTLAAFKGRGEEGREREGEEGMGGKEVGMKG